MKLQRVAFFQSVQLGHQGQHEGGAVSGDRQSLTLEQGFVHIVNPKGKTLVPMSNVAWMHVAEESKKGEAKK